MKPPPHPHTRLLAASVLFVCVLDQLSKALVREHMALGERIALLPGVLELVHIENRGIAWGLLTGNPLRLPFVTFLSLTTFLVMLGWFRRLRSDERLLAWSLALVLAGATGNFIDRLLYRRVTDFVEMSVPGALGSLAQTLLGSSSWAVFNIADIAITGGLVLFFWLAFRLRDEASDPETKEPSLEVGTT